MSPSTARSALLISGLTLALLSLVMGAWLFWLAGSLHLLLAGAGTLATTAVVRFVWPPPHA